MDERTGFHQILDRLEISAGQLIYLHTSFKYLMPLRLPPNELLSQLLARLGPHGTLVVPSFAWNLDRGARPWKGYADYYARRPIFDVRHTRANIGLIPDLCLSLPGAHRSASYWWSICALGPLAAELIRGQEVIEHPFGAGSSFELLRQAGARVVGLGVTLNTTSLAPLVDHAHGDLHPQQVFSSQPELGIIVDADGQKHQSLSFWMLPEIVRCIKPSRVVELSPTLQAAVCRADFGEAILFSYPYQTFHTEALRLGTSACEAGSPVPWLREYPLGRGTTDHDGMVHLTRATGGTDDVR